MATTESALDRSRSCILIRAELEQRILVRFRRCDGTRQRRRSRPTWQPCSGTAAPSAVHQHAAHTIRDGIQRCSYGRQTREAIATLLIVERELEHDAPAVFVPGPIGSAIWSGR